MGLFGSPNVEKMKAKKDVPGLIKALDYEKDPSVRHDAVKALGEIGDKQSVNPLIDLLNDRDSNLRRSVVVALGKIGDPSIIEALMTTLKDENANVRHHSAVALGKIGKPAVRPLVEAALKDENAAVRKAAAQALGKIDDLSAIETLMAAFKDENSSVRKNAVVALTEIGEPARKPLESVLQDEDDVVQKAAAEALGKIDRSTKLAAKKENERAKIKKHIQELHDLLRDVYFQWQDMGSLDFRTNPQVNAIHKIGEKLNTMGGHKTMLMAYNHIERRGNWKFCGILNKIWDGIGTWNR